MSEADDVQQLVRLIDPRLTNDQTDLYRRALEQFDRVILRRALEHSEGNLTRAAALLGLSRVTLRSKLRALGLSAGKPNVAEEGVANPARANNPGEATNSNRHPTEHGPQTHTHFPQPPGKPREVGQDLTRQDKPGSGFSEPHLDDAARREASGFHNIQSHK
ncbi:MAG TPA: helix-turn-helix domain-containing protein [Planctomycetaceae bacterium]|jgi:DNA-binding protein Fis|nr:helix-turn-helix domain-containing protein [Planctomycetaceae bacterium]